MKRAFILVCFFLSYPLVLPCRGAPLQEADEYACNICRDPPYGERVLIHPDKTFTQSNGVTVSCGELQEWVQDVSPSPSGGTLEEARYCKLVQYLAWQNCDCSGPELPSPEDEQPVKELNPVCDLCGGTPGFDFDFVPEPNRNKLVGTGCCGRHSCEILYIGASQGVLSSNLCKIVREHSGPECCNLDIVTPPVPDPQQDQDEDEDSEEDEEEEEDEEDEEDYDFYHENDDKCQDDPSFRFKGKEHKDCGWVADAVATHIARRNSSTASSSRNQRMDVCQRKSFGKKVWRSCPLTCGKCPAAVAAIDAGETTQMCVRPLNRCGDGDGDGDGDGSIAQQQCCPGYECRAGIGILAERPVCSAMEEQREPTDGDGDEAEAGSHRRLRH
eukprot:jgi/Psemu1/262989/estExt_Genewise1Plus.C_8960012